MNNKKKSFETFFAFFMCSISKVWNTLLTIERSDRKLEISFHINNKEKKLRAWNLRVTMKNINDCVYP